MTDKTSFFCDGDGNRSSKRIFGAITLCFAMILTVYVVLMKADSGVLMYPYSTASALLGLGVFEKRKRGDKKI